MLQSAAYPGGRAASAHDVFISYSSKDKTVADAICARLEARGIRCWIAPRDVQPGQPYGEEIIDAIHGSKAMVLVFSSNANASLHIPKEIERAVSHGVSIIPFRVEAVATAKSLDYFISSVHWLDAITPPLESHLETLANTLLAVLQVGRKVPELVVPEAPAQMPKKKQDCLSELEWFWFCWPGWPCIFSRGPVKPHCHRMAMGRCSGCEFPGGSSRPRRWMLAVV
jgi:TIR domain